MSVPDPPVPATSQSPRDDCGDPSGEHDVVIILTCLPRGVESTPPVGAAPPPNFAERQGPSFLLWMGLMVFAGAGVAGLIGHLSTALVAGTVGIITVALSVRIRHLDDLKVEIAKLFRIAAGFRSKES